MELRVLCPIIEAHGQHFDMQGFIDVSVEVDTRNVALTMF